jgi:hypothetical protein
MRQPRVRVRAEAMVDMDGNQLPDAGSPLVRESRGNVEQRHRIAPATEREDHGLAPARGRAPQGFGRLGCLVAQPRDRPGQGVADRLQQR